MKITYILLLSIATIWSCKNDSEVKEMTAKQQEAVLQKKYPRTNNYPEADQFDKAMEKDFVRAANDFQNEIIAQETLITSRNWVVYNDNAGRPINRNRIAVVTAQVKDRCFLQHLFFQQDASGSKYGTTYISDSYGWKEFDCSLKTQ